MLQYQRPIVIVQGGGYGEHQITTVRVDGSDQPVDVDHTHIVVRLAPGAVTRLHLGMERYANQPTLAFPWV